MDTVFFILSKAVPALLYPLPLILIVLAIFAFRQKKWKQKLTILIPLIILWVISTPLMLNGLLSLWEYPMGSRAQLEGNYDAAVVLGGLSAPELSDKTYVEFSNRVERIQVPLELYKEGRVGKILITSGSGSLFSQEDRESDSLGDFSLRWGVRPEDLLLERESRNTYENALYSGKILDFKKIHNFLLVTSAFHMKRSAAIFKKQGFTFTPYAVDTMKDPSPFPFNILPNPNSLGDFQTLVKEIMGYISYSITGYL